MKKLLRYLGIALVSLFLLALLLAAGWVAWINGQIGPSEIYAYDQDAPGAYADIDGYRIHYRLWGDPAADPTGAPILLIHGFDITGGAQWELFAPLLAERRSLIIPDLLGFGHSQRVTTPAPAYSHAGQARTLAALLDHLGVPAVDVIGTSYGGGIAAQLALDHAGRVRRIVFMDAQVYALGGGFFQVLGGLPLGIGRALTWSFQGASASAEAILTSGCGGAGGYCPPAAFVQQRKRLAQITGTTDALTAFNQVPLNARLPADLNQIDVPTLVVWGEDDTIIPVEQGRRLAEDIEGAALTLFPDTGHTPHLERPAETFAAVDAFLNAG